MNRTVSSCGLPANVRLHPPRTCQAHTLRPSLLAALWWGWETGGRGLRRAPQRRGRGVTRTRDRERCEAGRRDRESLAVASQGTGGGRRQRRRTRQRWLIARAGSTRGAAGLYYEVVVEGLTMMLCHAYWRTSSWRWKLSRRATLAWPYHRTARMCRGRARRDAKQVLRESPEAVATAGAVLSSDQTAWRTSGTTRSRGGQTGGQQGLKAMREGQQPVDGV